MLAAVAAGGALGAVLRWTLELTLPEQGPLPWATLLANVVGSAALAWLALGRGARLSIPGWVRSGLGTGVLGGFTTFSTYAVQVAVPVSEAPLLALTYAVLTPLLCLLAVAAVAAVGREESP